MTTELELEAHFVLTTVEDVDTIQKHVSLVMEELVKLSHTDCGISDPAVSLDLSDNTVIIEVIAFGDGFDETVTMADSCIRSAIHSAGGSTPTWNVEKRSQRAELVTA
jgi:hypothetical protein